MEDPDILTHTRVGPVGVTYDCLGSVVLSKFSCYDGIMYIKGDRLCYENSFCAETLCCECTSYAANAQDDLGNYQGSKELS